MKTCTKCKGATKNYNRVCNACKSAIEKTKQANKQKQRAANDLLIDWFMQLRKTTIGRRKYPFNKRYTVSTRGHIYDTIKKEWLQPVMQKGNFAVKIFDYDNSYVYKRVRVMVAETYISNGQPVPYVRPIDGNNHNTHFSNLNIVAREVDPVKTLLTTEKEIMWYLKMQDGKRNPKFFIWLCSKNNGIGFQ